MTHSAVSARILRVTAAGLAVVAAVFLLGACGEEVPAAGNVARGPAKGEAIELVAEDNSFEPGTLKVQAGDEVAIEVSNHGDQPHNFTAEELEVSTGTIEAGDVATATLTVPDGVTEFECTIHPGMDGRLVATSSG